MVRPVANKAAKVVKEEHLPSMASTATITGGGEFQRRYRNDYSKKSHADYEASKNEMFGTMPDISGPWILGGVRED
jgi:hypothetical protein